MKRFNIIVSMKSYVDDYYSIVPTQIQPGTPRGVSSALWHGTQMIGLIQTLFLKITFNKHQVEEASEVTHPWLLQTPWLCQCTWGGTKYALPTQFFCGLESRAALMLLQDLAS